MSSVHEQNRKDAEGVAQEIERRVREAECWFCEHGQGHSVSHHVGPWEAGMIAYAAALLALDRVNNTPDNGRTPEKPTSPDEPAVTHP